MRTTNQKSNDAVLSDKEYATTIAYFGKIIPICTQTRPPEVKQKITDHLVYIASQSVSALAYPSYLYERINKLKADGELLIFYKQLDFFVFSSNTHGYKDCYTRFCNNLASGMRDQYEDQFNIDSMGPIYEIAKNLYVNDFIDLFIKPSTEKMFRYFLLNHRHFVLQLALMQYYATLLNKSDE